jgi:hypothetical protein
MGCRLYRNRANWHYRDRVIKGRFRRFRKPLVGQSLLASSGQGLDDAMHVANFKLKNSVKSLLYKLQFIRDFFVLHPLREIQRIALADTVAYIREKMPQAVGLVNEREMFDMAFARMAPQGLLLEFGVHKGGTINYAAERNPGRQVHGFDSFEGLPDDWTGATLPKGAFDLKGRMPSVRPNVKLHKGLFSDTLPGWIAENLEPIAFVHVDCDLYQSTCDLFAGIGPRLGPGAMLLFDDYFNLPNWQAHGFRAFQEWVTEANVAYTYLAYARQQVLVRIDSVG